MVYSVLPENIILLQPTSPLRTGDDIDDCIKYYINSNCKSLVSVVHPHQHPLDMCYLDGENFYRLNIFKDNELDKGRQNYPNVWFIDGSIYIRDVEEFYASREVLCAETKIFEIPQSHGIDIDDDFSFSLGMSLIPDTAKTKEKL